MIESLPLAVTRVTTLAGDRVLTHATGFFFEREDALYLVTSRHVVLDEASEHRPDRIEIELHVDERNLGETVQFSIPLYRDGKSVWREGLDSAGAIDVVAILLERAALPKKLLIHAFRPENLYRKLDLVEMGAPVVARKAAGTDGRGDFPWMLLGVHSAKLDLVNRDSSQDESLDLNFAWYADILMTPTRGAAAAPGKA